ncbi:FAD-dependent oxidoreductase [Neobacillus sp. NPDC058068]|uniref:FAD-dependent oxidoreductase n=1 Tax=Neobacillus sp. NPDC058068 TaxID=3346325 RepID=UPI0036DD9870
MNREMNADIIIIGGGIGGCTAALAAAKMGKKVIMTEETDWIGGQLTSQAVPPDEHRWIEKFGATRTYREFRERVRDYYRRHYPLTEEARKNIFLNPGNAWVSRIAHEPRVSLAVLNDLLAPYISSGKITIMLNYKVLSAETEQDRVKSVTVKNLQTFEQITLTGVYFIDATECGDVLPLTGTEYVTGAESISETDEPHAIDGVAIPQDMQSITHCFIVDYLEDRDFTIEKPEQYDFWREYQADFMSDKLLSWYGVDGVTGKTKKFGMFPGENISLWDYRRIIDPSLFQPHTYEGEISIINWPQNDYWLGSIIDVNDEEKEKHLKGAKQLSLSFLYWLQTEAPRPDRGCGYRGLRLRKDLTGTEDGLAKYPYIRESRRIKAEFTVVEQHVSAELRGRNGIARFEDSVGVGCYSIDLHPTIVTNTTCYVPSYPFQIPLGSLLPIRMKNLLPACKNIGTTHITNGCYRLHPVEWNIGESVGYLVSYSLEKGVFPREVRNKPVLLEDFQRLLVNEGVELDWPRIDGALTE